MKKALITILLFAVSCCAQQTTPNIGLTLPPHGATNWDTTLNSNFTTIDTAIGAIQNAFKGAWSSTTTYAKGQQVTSGGVLYISLVNTNLNNPPAASPLQWQAMTAGIGSTDIFIPTGKVFGWTSDTSISRLSAASIGIGNGANGDTSGIVTAANYKALFGGNQSQWGVNGLMASSGVVGWGSTATPTVFDTGFSRIGAASIGVGNGTAGDLSGTLQANNLAATLNSSASKFISNNSGSAAGPAYGFQAGLSSNTGMYFDVGTGGIDISTGGSPRIAIDATGMGIAGRTIIGSGGVYAFGSAASPFSSVADAGLSRGGAGTINCGNGTAGNANCTFQANILGVGSTVNVGTSQSLTSSGITNAAGTVFRWTNGTFSGTPDTGLSRESGDIIDFGNGNQNDKTAGLQAGGIRLGQSSNGGTDINITRPGISLGVSAPITWTSAAPTAPGVDTGISRNSSGSVAIGNGTQSDASGQLQARVLNATNSTTQDSIVTFAGPRVGTSSTYGFTNGLAASSTTLDTGLSRVNPNQVAVGNGTPGDSSGAFVGNVFAQNNDVARINSSGFTVSNNRTYGFSSTTSSQGTVDAGFSRGGGNLINCGNGVPGDASCTLQAGTFSGQVHNATSSFNYLNGGVAAVAVGGDPNGSIELGPINGTSKSPFIDFHFHDATTNQNGQDFNVRLINGAANTLTVQSNSGAPNFVVGNGSITSSSINSTSVNTSTLSAGSGAFTSDASGNITGHNISPTGSVFIPNGSAINLKDTSGAAVSFSPQNDNNFVFYSTDATGASRPVWNVPMHSSSPLAFDVPLTGTTGSFSGALTGNTLSAASGAFSVNSSGDIGVHSCGGCGSGTFSGLDVGWKNDNTLGTSSGSGVLDTGLSRGGAGVVDVGNGSPLDTSGTVAANSFQLGTTTISQVSSGVAQLGSSGNNANGSLNLAGITIGSSAKMTSAPFGYLEFLKFGALNTNINPPGAFQSLSGNHVAKSTIVVDHIDISFTEQAPAGCTANTAFRIFDSTALSFSSTVTIPNSVAVIDLDISPFTIPAGHFFNVTYNTTNCSAAPSGVQVSLRYTMG